MGAKEKDGSSRQVPPALQKALKMDAALTETFCSTVNKIYPLDKCKNLLKGLEISCHTIPWIGFWLAFIWILWNQNLFEMQVNFFLGLLLDVVAVALIKAFTRRRRPPKNKADMFLTRGPDQYSFPSGHVSRAFFVTYFFSRLYPLGALPVLVLHVWSIAVSLSRVLLRRHYLLDVVAGTLLGFIESLLISLIWLSPETCLWIVSYVSDERIEGGEYHV